MLDLTPQGGLDLPVRLSTHGNLATGAHWGPDPLGPLPCRPHPSPKAPFPPQAPPLATNPAPQGPPHRPHPILKEQ